MALDGEGTVIEVALLPEEWTAAEYEALKVRLGMTGRRNNFENLLDGSD